MTATLRLETRSDGVVEVTPAFTILDCDGVIYDVNAGKVAAFEHALREAGEDDEGVAAFVAHHKATGGVSRYAKFDRWFREIRELSEAQADLAVTKALADYGAASRDAYASLGPRPEAFAFAEALGGPERVWVVSGSDERELREIFDEADIRRRFRQVYGSPTTKPAHGEAIVREVDVPSHTGLVVGDGAADLALAQELGCPFVFLGEMSEWAGAEAALAAADVSGRCLVARAATWDALLSWIVRAPSSDDGACA